MTCHVLETRINKANRKYPFRAFLPTTIIKSWYSIFMLNVLYAIQRSIDSVSTFVLGNSRNKGLYM